MAGTIATKHQTSLDYSMDRRKLTEGECCTLSEFETLVMIEGSLRKANRPTRPIPRYKSNGRHW